MTSIIEKSMKPLLTAVTATVLAIALSACEQQGQDQQDQPPPSDEQAQTEKPAKDATTAEKKKMGGAPPTTGAGQGAPSAQFQTLDTDHDGQISAKEARPDPMLSKAFKGLDADQDGQLNKTEFSAFSKKAAAGAGSQTGNPDKPKQSSGTLENPNRPKEL